jgi:drug/metabolite transporter (DMT)-like permease
MVVAIEMLCGGALLAGLGLLHGEAAALDLAAVSTRSWLSLAYLVVFGSLIGFSAYKYLLHATAPAVATTYAYVNPVVAVILGWAFAGESITPRTLAAMAVIVAAVVLITLPSVRGGTARAAEALDAEAA